MKLVLPLACWSLAACNVLQQDDSRGGFHDVTVNWRLLNVDETVMPACPPGFTTIAVHLYRANYLEPPDALVLEPCTPAGSKTYEVATSGELLDEVTTGSGPNAYFDYTPEKDIWIDVTEETQSAFAASSFLYTVQLDDDLEINFELYPEGGVGVGTWSLTSTFTGARLASCEAAGVDEIEAAARSYDDETAQLEVIGTWPCNNVDPYYFYAPDGNSQLFNPDELELGTGGTTGLAPGSYFIEMRAKRAGTVVGTAEASLSVEGHHSVHVIKPGEIPVTDR
jgi:hypothetical protein